MSNFFTLFNLANKRPHRLMLDTFCSLEGVSYILNQICKKCTKLEKNISLFVHLSAEKCTNSLLFAKSVQNLNKKINTNKYYIINKLIFFTDRLLTEKVSSLSFLFNKLEGKAIKLKINKKIKGVKMEKEFKPSWWVIVREGKKYIGCSNNCNHLKKDNDKMKCCYFEEEIKGEEDNYQPCGECFEVFCKTKFDVLNMTSYDSRNHFES